ncbi:MAG: DUF6465 family protein [Clostridiales bacterium]|nr:DUF6465 family protein [Clostridiales bacterium]MCD8215550.1 DUF6465 family protein [Clostridiales bacterium]
MTKSEFYVEFNGKKVSQDDIAKKAKEIWKDSGNKVKDLKTVELYYQPEAEKCYYVFNGESKDSVNGAFEV